MMSFKSRFVRLRLFIARSGSRDNLRLGVASAALAAGVPRRFVSNIARRRPACPLTVTLATGHRSDPDRRPDRLAAELEAGLAGARLRAMP